MSRERYKNIPISNDPPSISTLRDGQDVKYMDGGTLYLYAKVQGLLWRVAMEEVK